MSLRRVVLQTNHKVLEGVAVCLWAEVLMFL